MSQSKTSCDECKTHARAGRYHELRVGNQTVGLVRGLSLAELKRLLRVPPKKQRRSQ